MKKEFVITLACEDRPGIVASLSSGIFSLGGDIREISQTVVSGFFTVILMVSFKRNVNVKNLEKGVRSRCPHQSGVLLTVHEFRFSRMKSRAAQSLPVFVLTLMGADRPGIVAGISNFCSDRNMNIIDLYCDFTRKRFTLILQVQIPAKTDFSILRADLSALGRGLRCEYLLQKDRIFKATSEIEF